ncbi:nucleotidyltransferase domain-containing protein [Archaeoglobales archaeon]|nr:MAG: nucleotidyltransferase domain-containing protein [Archaeoglobales archaeon]
MQKLTEKVERIVTRIKTHPNVIAIYLFGSYAKGEQTPMSDIDIAVILRNPTAESEAEIASFSSPNIEVVLFHRLPLYIKFEVFKYGKELFVGDEEELLQIKMKVMREYLDTTHLYRTISSEVLG